MKTIHAAAALGVAGLAAGAFWLAGAPAGAAAPAAAASAPAAPRGGVPVVRLAPAQRQDVAVELQANGTVVPLSSVEIRPHVTRLLTKVHVKEGQFVASGALLFALDDRVERAALDRAQAQLLRDQATLADVERQFRRSQDLAAQRFISTSAADTLQTQAESQRALVQADQAAVRSAQVDLSYTQIRAPSAGRVGAVNVYPGSLVQANAVLASVTRIDPIAVSFTVPESGLAGLLEGQRKGDVAVSAALADPARTLNGKLSFIDSAVDTVAGSIRVKAQFDNAAQQLWPGQYVHAKVTLATLRDAVVVPLAAIVSDSNGSRVYEVGADQLAQPHKVRVLHAFGKLAAVSGLHGGEQIIIEGKQNLRPGSKVKVSREPLPAAAPALAAADVGAAR